MKKITNLNNIEEIDSHMNKDEEKDEKRRKKYDQKGYIKKLDDNQIKSSLDDKQTKNNPKGEIKAFNNYPEDIDINEFGLNESAEFSIKVDEIASYSESDDDGDSLLQSPLTPAKQVSPMKLTKGHVNRVRSCVSDEEVEDEKNVN